MYFKCDIKTDFPKSGHKYNCKVRLELSCFSSNKIFYIDRLLLGLIQILQILGYTR